MNDDKNTKVMALIFYLKSKPIFRLLQKGSSKLDSVCFKIFCLKLQVGIMVILMTNSEIIDSLTK